MQLHCAGIGFFKNSVWVGVKDNFLLTPKKSRHLMPIMNGIELCQKLKELNDKITIVMLSASNDSNYLVDAINMGINKFLINKTSYSRIVIV